jgi:hypothetical protein
MRITLSVFLYFVAVVLIALTAFGVSTRRVSLAWLGMALAVFTFGVLPAVG